MKDTLVARFLQSPTGQRLLQEERERAARARDAEIARLESEANRLETEHETSSATLARKVDAATVSYDETKRAYDSATKLLQDLTRQRMRESYAYDANLSDLRAKLEALRQEAVHVGD